MSNAIPIALGVYEGQEQVEQKEQNNDKKSSHSENNSQQINYSDEVIIREEEIDNNGYIDKTNYDVFNVRKEGYFFADEIKVDGETIFTISLENQLDKEEDKPKRKSRWGDRPQRRKKAQINHIFNPLQGLTTGNGLLSITAEGYKHGQQYEKKEEEEEKFSRWGPEYEKTFHPPLLNFIPQSINDDDLEYIIRLFRLDEIQNKINNKIKTVEDDEDCRSPSPPPIYNDQGKRINTREYREQESLQKEKYNLIEEAMRINGAFIPPHDFKIQKKQRKIYLPEQNSELLKQKVIGPKGQTHKRLEQESGCKISIKGKGSGNGMKRVENDVNDQLHVLLQADTDEQLDKGSTLVDEILRGEDKTQDTNAQSDSRGLAIIHNVIFGGDICPRCHQTGHKEYECQTKTTFNKVDIKCIYCGDKGHVSQDCKYKKDSLRNRDRGNDMDVGHKFEQFINQVEGDNGRLLGNFGGSGSSGGRNNKISNTSFATDTIEIDPNLLMLKADDSTTTSSSYRGKESYSSGPSHGSYNNDYQDRYNNRERGEGYNKYKENKFRDNNNNDYHRERGDRGDRDRGDRGNNDRYNNNRQSDSLRSVPPTIPPSSDQIVPPFMAHNTMAPFQGAVPNPNMPMHPGAYFPPPGGYPMMPPYGQPPYGMPPPMYPMPGQYGQPYGYNPYPQGNINQPNNTQK